MTKVQILDKNNTKSIRSSFICPLPQGVVMSTNQITAFKFLLKVWCKFHFDWLLMMSPSNIHICHPIYYLQWNCLPKALVESETIDACLKDLNSPPQRHWLH